jgi:hypothetical protein
LKAGFSQESKKRTGDLQKIYIYPPGGAGKAGKFSAFFLINAGRAACSARLPIRIAVKKYALRRISHPVKAYFPV